ncbi:MAG: hypothetical protein AABY96_11855 [Nitrospirota bacterium]
MNPSKVATRYYWNGVVDSVSWSTSADLAQEFPFSFEPVVEITAILTAPRLVPFEHALRNQNTEIVQGQTRGFSHVCVIRAGRNDPLRSKLRGMSTFKE